MLLCQNVRIDVADGSVERRSEHVGVVSSASYSRDHSRVAYLLQHPERTGEVYVSNGDGEHVRVTDANRCGLGAGVEGSLREA